MFGVSFDTLSRLLLGFLLRQGSLQVVCVWCVFLFLGQSSCGVGGEDLIFMVCVSIFLFITFLHSFLDYVLTTLQIAFLNVFYFYGGYYGGHVLHRIGCVIVFLHVCYMLVIFALASCGWLLVADFIVLLHFMVHFCCSLLLERF